MLIASVLSCWFYRFVFSRWFYYSSFITVVISYWFYYGGLLALVFNHIGITWMFCQNKDRSYDKHKSHDIYPDK